MRTTQAGIVRALLSTVRRKNTAEPQVELDEDEYVACRVEAAFTAGFLFWQLGDREKAGRHYHTVLRLAEGASRAERTRRLVFAATPGGIPGEHPAGVAIDAIAATARDNLRRAGLLRDGCGFEGPAPGLRDAQAAARPGVLHSGGGIAARVTDVPRTASTSIDRMALVEALLNATGGRCCDQCGREPAAGQKLLLCGRCKLTYYCGADCQKTAWRGGGHKATCRAPSDLREGDLASAFDLKARPDLNGQFCRVVGAAGDDAARWQVTFIGTNETVALKPANVKRCRPPSGPV